MAEGHTQRDLGATKTAQPPFKKLPMKGPDVSVDRRPDGTVYLWANQPPGDRPRSIPHLLDQRAGDHPQRPYLRQRLPAAPGETIGPWRAVSYGDAKAISDSLAQALHVSGPVAMAVAGLLIGNAGVALAVEVERLA